MKQVVLSIFFLLPVSVCLAMDSQPPGPAERLRAIGPTRGLPETLRLALDAGSDFEPIPAPRPGDWLAVHPEPGQTFEDFGRSRPNRPDGTRRKIYLQPLGEFPRDRSPALEILKEYAASYFVTETEVFPSLAIDSLKFITRSNPYTRNRQVLTTDVLIFLRKRLPADAFCLLAITMEDLYPEPSWNFVFGQASLRERVGVFSFARYDPAFHGEERGKSYSETLLRRSCKVLAHETAHMFSLAHCIFFRCVLNGSNHLQESDSRPLSLCPVCLRKLQYSIGFDVVARYRQLFDFYRKVAFEPEARWVATRLGRIAGHEGVPPGGLKK
jgi:archaemetzincin